MGDLGYDRENRVVWRAVIHLREAVEELLSAEGWGLCSVDRADITPPSIPTGDWTEPTYVNQMTIKFAQHVFEFLTAVCAERQMHGWDIFVQLETTGNFFHIHCCVLVGGEYGVRQIAANFRRAWERTLFLLSEEPIERRLEWLSLTRAKHGRCQRGDKTFLRYYLLPKLSTEGEVVWAWSTVFWAARFCVSDTERRSLRPPVAEMAVSAAPTVDCQPAVYASNACEKTLALAGQLQALGIVTGEQFRDRFPEVWASYSCVSSGEKILNAALQMNIAKARGESTGLVATLIGSLAAGSISRATVSATKPWNLLELQGYDPLAFGSLVVLWLERRTGKRNTLWLYGPPSTGKTNFASALARACPNYGMVNWNNVNFPFNDCCDKNIIFWDEGFINGSIVEQTKAILGGQEVRVDQKNKGSKPLKPTPVLVTSNVDMTVTHCGNTSSTEHRGALRDRMLKVDFNRRLGSDWGLISTEDLRVFLAYCKENLMEISPSFEPLRGSRVGAGPSPLVEWLRNAPNRKRKYPFNADTEGAEESISPFSLDLSLISEGDENSDGEILVPATPSPSPRSLPGGSLELELTPLVAETPNVTPAQTPPQIPPAPKSK